MSNGKPKWTKCGHRSVKHNSYPKMVVRFGKSGTGSAKGKLLISAEEFKANEERQGRDADKTLLALIAEACERWREIREQEQREKETVF